MPPAIYSSVVLDVRQIEVHLKEEKDPDGWKNLAFTPQAINVLDYVNGTLGPAGERGLRARRPQGNAPCCWVPTAT